MEQEGIDIMPIKLDVFERAGKHLVTPFNLVELVLKMTIPEKTRNNPWDRLASTEKGKEKDT